jgi:hypothetical protein
MKEKTKWQKPVKIASVDSAASSEGVRYLQD